MLAAGRKYLAETLRVCWGFSYVARFAALQVRVGMTFMRYQRYLRFVMECENVLLHSSNVNVCAQHGWRRSGIVEAHCLCKRMRVTCMQQQ